MRKLASIIFLVLFHGMAFSQTWTQMGQDIDGLRPGDECGWSVSFSSSGNRLALSSPADNSDRGNVRVFWWDGASWVQFGQTLFGEGAFDFFGRSVSFSSDGNRLAIGAGGNDNSNGANAGHTRVYEWDGNSWIQLGQDIDGEAAGDESGRAVSISSDGSRIAIGALFNDGNGTSSGHVRVYEWNGNSWGQVGQDIDGLGAGDESGRAVSISSDGNRVAFGSPADLNNRGNALTYEWNGTSWIPLGGQINGEMNGDQFGYSVSMSSNGNRVAIGAPFNDGVGSPAAGSSKGHVRVYNWNGTGWVQLGQDIDGAAVNDFSGTAVSMSSNGSILAIGAPGNNANINDEGHVRVYKWNGISWVQIGQDIDGESLGDNSGNSVSFSSNGRRLAIGAKFNDANGSSVNTNAGHVRVYRIDADSTIFINSCDSFLWSQNNTTYYSSGVYSDTTYLAGFIDSIFNLDLSISVTQQSLEVVDVCDLDSFVWARNNQVYHNSGVYIDTFSLPPTVYDETIRIDGDDLFSSPNIFSFNNATQPLSNGTLVVRALGDLDAFDERWRIQAENGLTLNVIGASGTQCASTLSISIPLNQVDIASWAADSIIDFSAVNANGAIDAICSNNSFVEMQLTYSTENICTEVATLDLSLAEAPAIVEEVSCDSFHWAQTNQSYALSGLYSDTIQGSSLANYDSVISIAGLSLDSSNNFSFSSPGTPVSGGTLYISAVGDLDGDGVTIGQPFEQWTIFDESSSVRGTLGATGIIGGQCSDTLFIAIPLTQAEINAWSLDGSIDFDVTDLTGNVSVDLGFCIPNQFVEARLEYQYLDIRCDSIVTLDLTINNSVTTTLIEQACDSFVWNGQIYTTTGVYQDTFTTSANCDSIVTINLTINNSASSTDSVESCDSFYWSQANQTYYATGVYSYTTTSSNGCDSTIILDLTILNQIGGRWVQLGQDIDGESAGDFFGLSVIFSSDGTRIAVAADFNDANGNNAGHVRVYDWNSNSWIQAGQDILGEVSGDLFGSSVAFSSDGNRLAIGAIFNDASGNDAGHVRVYDWDGSFWVQVGQDIDGELAGDHFGRSVSFSSNGNHLAIGAPYNDGNGNGSGHVRVYDWDGAQWNQQGQDIDGEAAGDNLGQSVSFSADGSRLAIGASNDAGYVRVYDWDGNLWVQTGQDIDGEASFDYSGESISFSSDGNRLAIGAIGNDGNGSTSGHTRVYTWNGTSWVQLGSDIDGESIGDRSGSSVSFASNGNRLVIGASYNNDNGNNAGHARVYEWDGISWIQLGQDIDGEAADDNLGWSVNFSSNGNRLVVGAPYNDDNGDGAGQARVYEFEALLLEAISDTIDTVACDSFTWIVNSQTYLTSGFYQDTLFTQNGCDSVYAHLNLTINNSFLTTQTEQACDSFVWNGQVYLATGTYRDTFATSASCDSIAILDLTINNSITTTLIEQACDSFVWNGQVYAMTGIYRDTFTTSANCDSIEILDLTINNSVTTTLIEQVCDNFVWNGQVYTTTGIYLDTFTTSANCDSIAILDLTIDSVVQTTQTEQSCDSFEWNGQVYTVSGIYRDTSILPNGCDSITTLDLTINNSVTTTLIEQACDSFVWNGQLYRSSGVYFDTLIASSGCDSINVLDLTILNQIGSRWLQLGQDIDGEAALDNSGFSVSMPNDTTLAIGGPTNDGNGATSGHVRVYNWNGSAWIQKGQDIDGESSGDFSGRAVIMPDANTLGIGAPLNSDNGNTSGHVRVYNWNGSAWIQKGQDIDGESLGDEFGEALSMPDANTVAIGAYKNDGNGNDAGHVRIFEWNGSSWIQKGIDIDGETADDNSGESVSMPNSNTVAIGARFNSDNGNNAGHARVYQWDGISWVQKGQDIDGASAMDRFGEVLYMPDPNTLAVAAMYNDMPNEDFGLVRIYTWDGSSWVQKGQTLYGEARFDGFGSSISMPNSNLIAIGAAYNDGNSANGMDDRGHVRVYRWDGALWQQLGLDIDGEAAGDNSAKSVSMPSEDILAIGANNNNGFAGHVRVYELEPLVLEVISDTIDTFACNNYTWPVNGQTYNSSGLYQDTLFTLDGCDSLYAYLNLVINQDDSVIQVEQSCDSFVWNGQVYSTTGIYRDTFLTSTNCDSIVILDLTINNSVTTTLIEQACDSFMWNGQVYTTTGIYRDTFTTSANCDSIEILDLTLNNSVTTTLIEQACDSFVWNGQAYATTGIYRDTFTTSANCDSIAILDLTIDSVVQTTQTEQSCDSFEWNGQVYTVSGIYRDTSILPNGCDSIAILDLTINNSVTTTLIEQACDSFVWNGQVYTTTGIYRDTFSTSANCDSIEILDLTINNSVTTTVTEQACDSFVWNGQAYTTTGIYSDTFTTSANCDSIAILDLTVNSSDSSIDTRVSCDSLLWIDGNTYYSSTNTPSFSLTTMLGCDSIVTLDLTINPTYLISDTIIVDYEVEWQGQILSESGNYRIDFVTSENCDSIYILNLEVNFPELALPTAFSPNGDGFNDVYRPVSYVAQEIEFKVFNRWGELLYLEIGDRLSIVGWDGSYKGNPAPMDNYVFLISYKDDTGVDRHLRGNFTLIR